MPSSARFVRGVNLSGAEWGRRFPGELNRDFIYPSARTYLYFASKNLNVLRLCVSWERLQPQLHSALDPFHLGLLQSNVAWAKKHGARIVINIHNFGRYKMNVGGALETYVLDNLYDGTVKVSGADLTDLWARLSAEFKAEPAVYAYGLMNEPHDMGQADWKRISQDVLNGIRANGDDKLVMVPGLDWSGAENWARNHGPNGWIADPANNFAYEAHTYFDSDRSGTYANSYDWELARNPDLTNIGPRRLKPFVDWCRANRARCYLGEFGVPGDDPRWLAVLETFLQALDAAGLDGTYWAAGEWWGDYRLSVQPRPDFNTDAPQLPVLLGHLPAGAFTTVSAASSSGYYFAPGSLVSGYGRNLAGSEDVILEVRDSEGVPRTAPLIFVSQEQINYLIPEDAALGHADITVKNGGVPVAQGVLWLERTAPALFSAAAQVVLVAPDGAQTWMPFVAAPIEFPDSPAKLFLILYGTGFRGAKDSVALQVDGLDVPLTYAGPQLQYPGLDQANAELPRSLAGAGEVPVVFTVDGKAANRITLEFR